MTETKLEEMNLNLLLSLDALLEEENVTHAARRVGIGQSAMSRNLGTLRNIFSDDLLVRVGNEMLVTHFARALKPDLQGVLADLRRILRGAGRFSPQHATGRVRIACPSYLAVILGIPLLNILADEAPGLSIRIEHISDMKIGESIQRGVDLVIGPALDLGASVQSQILFKDTFSCLVRNDHPILEEEFDIDAYLKLSHILISPTGRSGSRVDEVLGEKRRRVPMQVSSFLAAPAIVAKTDLVLTAPTMLIRSATTLFPVTQLDAPFELAGLPMAVFWDPRRNNDERLRWILEKTKASLKQ